MQAFFRTKVKKREAPKCLPLWSLRKQTPIYFPMFGANPKGLHPRPNRLILKGLHARAVRANRVFTEVVFSGIEWCLHRLWIYIIWFVFTTVFSLFFVKNNLRARAEKTFFAKKPLTRKKTYVTIYRPLGPGGILSHFSEIASFFYFFSQKSEAPKSLALNALQLANQPSRNPHSASH